MWIIIWIYTKEMYIFKWSFYMNTQEKNIYFGVNFFMNIKDIYIYFLGQFLYEYLWEKNDLS